jgi:hypothetical protein
MHKNCPRGTADLVMLSLDASTGRAVVPNDSNERMKK